MIKKYFKLLNDFANDLTIATEIKVEITEHQTSFTPRTEQSYARYEDANLLSSILKGAENLLYYLERNNYKIIKQEKK